MSQPMNPYDSPEPARTGMSGTAKLLMVLGITFGVLGLLCCGGIGGGLFWSYRLLKNSMSEDPATIHRITDEIASIEIPESFEPKVSVDFQVPFTGQKSIKWVAYEDAAHEGSLMLAQFDEAFGDEASMREQLRISVRDSGRGDRDDIDVKTSEKYESEINGAPAKFTIAEGTRRNTSHEYWEVVGTFRGKEGPAILIFTMKAADFSKEDVMKVIHSIK